MVIFTYENKFKKLPHSALRRMEFERIVLSMIQANFDDRLECTIHGSNTSFFVDSKEASYFPALNKVCIDYDKFLDYMKDTELDRRMYKESRLLTTFLHELHHVNNVHKLSEINNLIDELSNIEYLKGSLKVLIDEYIAVYESYNVYGFSLGGYDTLVNHWVMYSDTSKNMSLSEKVDFFLDMVYCIAATFAELDSDNNKEKILHLMKIRETNDNKIILFSLGLGMHLKDYRTMNGSGYVDYLSGVLRKMAIFMGFDEQLL